MATCVVTGADRGIGAALVRLYHARGDRAIGVCQYDGRDLAKERIEVVPNIDVTDGGAVAGLAKALEGVHIDILVSVAGIGLSDGRGAELDYDRVRRQFEVNALGPLRVVRALRDRLGRGGKVGIVTSRMGSIGDNHSGGMYGYRLSKAAANQVGVNLYHELRALGVSVMLLHPGTVATEMTKGAKGWDQLMRPEQAAAGLAEQLDRLGPDRPPELRHSDGTLLPW